MSSDRETMKQAGLVHVLTLPQGEHILYNKHTDTHEVWFANKNHASYGIVYKNTHLEYARDFGMGF